MYQPTLRSFLTPCIGSTEQKNDPIRYLMREESYIRSLIREAVKSGNTETFSEEVTIRSIDTRDNTPHDEEIYVARFTTHASWGLRLDMDIAEIDDEGHKETQTLWLEFVRDAK